MKDTESSIRRILKSDIALLISIIIGVYTFITMVILPIKAAQNEIAVIKGNHLTHIQNDIAEIKVALKENQTNTQEIDKKLERVLTLLEQK